MGRPFRFLALLGLAGCNALFGVEELGFDATGSGPSGGGTQATGGGGSGGTTTTGGGGSGGIPPAVGELQWARAYGGTGVDVSRGVVFSPSGALRVAGGYTGDLKLGALELPPASAETIFVAELDPDGDPLWARAWPGLVAGAQHGASIAADGGAVLLTGRFADAIDFGAGAIPASGGDDGFLAKLSPNGSLAWATTFGNTGNDAGWAVAPGPQGTAVVAGSFADSIVVAGQTYPGHPDQDGIVIAFDAGGSAVGAATFGGPGDTYPRAIATRGDVAIITGYYTGTIDLQPGVLPSAGGTDVFVLAFDSSGLLWGLSLGASLEDLGFGVAIGSDGTIYVVGSYQGSVLVDANTVLTAVGGADAFLIAFDPDGKPRWAKSFGSPGEERFYGVAVDSQDRLAITGYYTQDLDLGGGPLPTSPSTSLPYVVVAKLDAAGDHVWSHGYPVSVDQQAGTTARALRAVGVGPGDDVAITGTFEGTIDLGPLTAMAAEDFFVARYGP